MSRRIVGYEGEGRHRRPIYSEPLTDDLRSSPPGPVERRVATAEERYGFAPRVVAPGLVRLPPREVERIQLEEVATERVLAVITGPTVSARTIEEEPAMDAVAAAPEPIESFSGVLSPSEARIYALEELQTAALEAKDAIRRLDDATTFKARAEEFHEIALRRLGRAQTAVRDALDPTAVMADDFRREITAKTHDRVSVGEANEILDRVASAAEQRHERLLHGELADIERSLEGVAVTTFTDSEEPADDAPEIVTRPAAGGGPEQTGESKQDRILAAVGRLGGDLRAVAADRNTTPANVVATLHNLGKRGRLTPETIALLPAVFAKYSVVGR